MFEGYFFEFILEVVLELWGSVVFFFIFIKNWIIVWVFWGILVLFNLNKYDVWFIKLE